MMGADEQVLATPVTGLMRRPPTRAQQRGAGHLQREDEPLARAAAAGDDEAFAVLYTRYSHRVLGFCLRLLGSVDDAADATQEAFARTLQRLPALSDRKLNFSAYLFAAARNASLNMLAKTRRVELTDEVGERVREQAGRQHADVEPERAALLSCVQSDVRTAAARLPERHQVVLALREVEGLSYAHIAAILDMNENSVAQLLSRARLRLRDELRGSALASVAVSTSDCEQAMALMVKDQDGTLNGERPWLEEHVSGCANCAVRRDAMHEAGASYRGWVVPMVGIEWLRRATRAEAALAAGRAGRRGWAGRLARSRMLGGAVGAVAVTVLAGVSAGGIADVPRESAYGTSSAATAAIAGVAQPKRHAGGRARVASTRPAGRRESGQSRVDIGQPSDVVAGAARPAHREPELKSGVIRPRQEARPVRPGEQVGSPSPAPRPAPEVPEPASAPVGPVVDGEQGAAEGIDPTSAKSPQGAPLPIDESTMEIVRRTPPPTGTLGDEAGGGSGGDPGGGGAGTPPPPPPTP